MKIKTFFMLSICVLASIQVVARAQTAKENSEVGFREVKILYPRDECSFRYSPVDFCDNKHIEKYNWALKSMSANFNQTYILLPIKEWQDSDEQSLVAIDKNTGIVYPIPIDSFSPYPAYKSKKKNIAALQFSKNSNQVCIDGEILVYRATQTGKFCFQLDGDKFVGYHTTYMGHDNP
jgi:hypothetical protein